MELNREQIIKALECISNTEDVLCEGCAYKKYDGLACHRIGAKNALALIKEQEEQIFKLENRLKECENGCEGTVFLDRCKLHDAEEKVKEITEERKDFEIRALRAENEATKYKDRYETEKQAREQLSESYDHLEKTKDELLAERGRLTEENERLRAATPKCVEKVYRFMLRYVDKLSEIDEIDITIRLGQIAKEMLEGEE